MELLDSLKKLHDSDEFSYWKDENKEAYLSHAFMMKEPHREGIWEFGFSDEKSSVTVFEVKEKITIRPPQDAFRKDEAKIPALDEKRIKKEVSFALSIVDDIVKEKYAGQKPMKMMVVVQTLPAPIGQCYNISYVLHSFKILNVKIGTESGIVLDERMVSLIQDS